jgi:hypothetical protein
MKILYLTSGKGDHLEVQLFHGLRQLYGTYVVDYPRMDCAYYGFDLNKVHGRGFGSFGVLQDVLVDRTDIELKIHDKYFDLVIYGAGYLSGAGGFVAPRMLDLILDVYPKEQVFMIDGDDGKQINHKYVNMMTYFKRELHEDDLCIYPIGFSFPFEKMYRSGAVIKERWFATSKPKASLEEIKKVDPYEFPIPIRDFEYFAEYESDLYEDYRRSHFGITMKKAGWDCQRHYEIAFNLCLPYFWDIEDCPPRVMTHWNKELLKKILRFPNVSYDCVDESQPFDYPLYNELFQELWNHSYESLTTTSMANYVLSFVE